MNQRRADYEVIVVGLGAMGSCALWALARRGVRVLGIDQFDPPHDQGSSHGETRLIRSAMIEGAPYVPLIRRAFTLWHELAEEAQRELLVRTGVLFISSDGAGHVAAQAARALSSAGLPFETLTGAELERRYPQHRDCSQLVAALDPSGGFVRAEETVAAGIRLAEQRGAAVMRRTSVTSIVSRPDGGVEVETDDRGIITAGRVVVSAGAWLSTLLRDRGIPVAVERQVFAYFELDGSSSFAPDAFPAFMRVDAVGDQRTKDAWLSHGLSGFPSLDDARLKLVLLEAGRPTALETLDRRVPDAQLEELKTREVDPRLAGLSRVIPGSGHACLYTNSPDRDFIIGPLPGEPDVILLSACSGHGFKFSPAVGELGADLATDTRPHVPIEAFAPTRLRAAFSGRA
ncbi:MAG: N-methyl-L-tryptophan oxidase [Solirubrobacterales bacterium]|nr:N-methyl-L-tryptophan oxidase [Solirubrobacterales bacterium]